jgi:hypothetical protein
MHPPVKKPCSSDGQDYEEFKCLSLLLCEAEITVIKFQGRLMIWWLDQTLMKELLLSD